VKPKGITKQPKTIVKSTIFNVAVPWFRRLFAGLSQRRPGFDPGSVYVEFVVDNVALGTGFSLGFSPSVLH
jgi:hypothetical protein